VNTRVTIFAQMKERTPTIKKTGYVLMHYPVPGLIQVSDNSLPSRLPTANTVAMRTDKTVTDSA